MEIYMSTIRRALSNTLYLMGDWSVIMIFGYIFWVILAKMLSPSEVGIFSTISNIAVFLTAFTTLGFNISVIKIIAEYISKEAKDFVAGIVFYTLKNTIIFNLLIISIMIAFLRTFFPGYLGWAELIGISIYTIINSLYAVAQGYLSGFQDMRKIFLTDMFAYTLKIILVTILIISGFSFFGPVAAFSIATLIAFFWRMEKISIRNHKINEAEMWSYSIPAMISSLGIILLFQSTVIILGVMKNMSDVGIFTLAFMLVTPIRAVFQVISNSLMPIGSGKLARQAQSGFDELMNQSIRYSLLIVLPLTVMFFIFSSDILLLFTKTDYLAGAHSMRIIAIGSLLVGISYILSAVLYTAGMVRESRNVNLLGGICNTVLCVILIPFLGLIGAAFSYLLACVISSWFSISLCQNKLKLHSAYLKKLVTSFIILCLMILLLKYLIGGIYSLIFSIIFGIPLYFILLIYLRFFGETDIKILDILELKFIFLKPVLSPIKHKMRKHMTQN